MYRYTVYIHLSLSTCLSLLVPPSTCLSLPVSHMLPMSDLVESGVPPSPSSLALYPTISL